MRRVKHGEGQTFLGSASVTTDATGNAVIPFIAAGRAVRDRDGDRSSNATSEFSACVQVTAGAGTADLAITKIDTPDPVTVGQPLTYSITVSNLGPQAASNVVVTDTLPAGVTLVSAASTVGGCSGTAPVTCTIGSMGSATTVTIAIVVTPTTPGTSTNTAAVDEQRTDPVAANNSASTTTTVVTDGPATFFVISTGDCGPGTLRQAIVDANAHAGPDTIRFNIAGAGVHTIAPATNFPTITGPTAIDGTTQPGYAGLPLIELSGANAPANGAGLFVTGSNSVIKGLIVNRFGGTGIIVGIAATGTRVEGDWIGLTADGTAAAGNGFGVIVRSPGSTIGGTSAAQRNVISGNQQTGLYM